MGLPLHTVVSRFDRALYDLAIELRMGVARQDEKSPSRPHTTPVLRKTPHCGIFRTGGRTSDMGRGSAARRVERPGITSPDPLGRARSPQRST